MSILNIAGYASFWIVLLWLYSGVALYYNKQYKFGKTFVAIAKFLYHEIKPFYWPIALIHQIDRWLDPNEHISIKIVGAILTFLTWQVFKNVDDDDRWKRRKQKLLEKVKVEAGKLVTVPVPA